MILLCKEIIVAKSKDVKTGSNMAEFSKEGYGSKNAVLPTMIMKYCESGGIASYVPKLGSRCGEWSASHSSPFTSEERNLTTHVFGVWVKHWSGLDVSDEIKISAPSENGTTVPQLSSP
jgi:hypothetical protein